MKVLHWSSPIQLCLVFDWRWEFLLCFLLQLRCFGVAGMQFWKDFLHGRKDVKAKRPLDFLNLKNGPHFHIEDSLPWCPQDFPNQTYTQNKYPAYTTSNSTRRSATSPSVHLAALIFETAPGFFVWANAEHGCGKWKKTFRKYEGNTFLQIACIQLQMRHLQALKTRSNSALARLAYKSASKQGNCVDQDLSERARESDMSNIQNQSYAHLTKTKVTKISYDNIHISSRERERETERRPRTRMCVYMSLDTFANKNACWIVVKMYVLQHSSDSNAFSSTQNKPTSFTFQIFYSNILAKCNL